MQHATRTDRPSRPAMFETLESRTFLSATTGPDLTAEPAAPQALLLPAIQSAREAARFTANPTANPTAGNWGPSGTGKTMAATVIVNRVD